MLNDYWGCCSFVLFFILLVFGTFLWAEKEVRVLVSQGKKINFACIDYELRSVDHRHNKRLTTFRTLPVSSLEVDHRGIKINGQLWQGDSFLFIPMDSRYSSLFVDGKTLRGILEIVIFKEEGEASFINYVDETLYLTSVLSYEVKSSWPKEFLKAQAIISRTYLYRKMEQFKERSYHVVATTFDQLYGGLALGFNRIEQAVKETSSLILTYQHQISEVFFHSTCGGQTEEVHNVWQSASPYSQSVKCTYCQSSPYYTWESKVSGEKLAQCLKGGGCVQRIEVLEHSPHLRNKKVCIYYTDHSYESMSGSHFRMKVGPSVVKSTWFNWTQKGGYFYLKGRGWGHGVGMCQYGAYELATKRYQFRDILKYYYPLCRISLWV